MPDERIPGIGVKMGDPAVMVQATEKKSSWMNSKALGRAAYQPTDVEHWANMVTHGVFVLPAVYGGVMMVMASRSDIHQLAAAVYGLGLAGLFSVSTIFHVVFYMGYYKNLKDVLHRSDRAMIYVFIASSYTPWLLLRPLPLDSWTLHLRWGIWVLAVLGIMYQQLFHERFKMLETIFYLIIGILPSLAVMDMDDHSGLDELKLGGAIYVIGVIFFKLDGRIPLAHAIWHLFVVLGAFIHYYAVLTYLILPTHPESSALTSSEAVDQDELLRGQCDISMPECSSL